MPAPPTPPASTSGSHGQKIKYFRYVTFERMGAYKALGWIIHDSLAMTHHGVYGDLAEWPFETDPIEPIDLDQ